MKYLIILIPLVDFIRTIYLHDLVRVCIQGVA